MKNLASIVSIFTIILLSFTSNAIASDSNSDNHIVTISIPEVALLDLEGAGSIILEPSQPTEPGEGLDFSTATNSDAWLNYSSVVAAGKSRNITVKLQSDNVPAGLTLKVEANSYQGEGKGTMGNPVQNAVSLNADANGQTLISGIGSCYTGDDISNGHNLVYSLEIDPDTYGQLKQDETDITVIYTLTEDN